MDPDIGVDDPPEETVGQYSLVLLAPRRSDASALRRGLRRAAKSKRVEEGAAKVAARRNRADDGSGNGGAGKSNADESRDAQEVPRAEAEQRNSKVAVEATRQTQGDDSADDHYGEEVAEDKAGGDTDERDQRTTPTAIVVRTGVGPRRSRKAVRDDHLFTGKTIAVAGVGRALADRVQPGDVVVADQVRTDALTEGVVPPTRLVPSAPRIAALLRQQGLTVHVGSVISTDNRVNDTVRDRLAMTRALVADRESAWLLAACGKIPIACVRVATHRRMRGWRKTARTLRIVSATLTEWAAS
jgi:nucleoside phosphorylase